MSKKNFEQSYMDLQSKIKDLQDETKTLDESIENFKQAVKLHAECQSILNDANEQIIEIMGEDNDTQNSD